MTKRATCDLPRYYVLMLLVVWCSFLANHQVLVAQTSDMNVKRNAAPNGNHFALLIGVSRYDNASLAELPGAEPDAVDLANALANNGYRRENVVTMTLRTGAEDPRLLPTANNIRKQLKRIAKEKKPQDLLLIAMAGHGFQLRDEYFFCPSDANVERPETLVAIPEIYKSLENCNAGFKLLLVDACRENVGPASQDRSNPVVDARIQNLPNPPANMAAFFSCSSGQLAYERNDGRRVNGVFFHAIQRGLNGAAAGADGFVTLPDLERFVKRDVEDYVAKTYASAQHPVIRNNTVGLVPLLAQSILEKRIKQAADFWIRSQRKEATAIIDSILAEQPDHALALAEKGRMLCDDVESSGDTSRSDEMLRLAMRAVELAPHRVETHLARSNIYRVREEYEKSLEDCRTVLTMDPDNSFAYLYRAVVYQQLEQFDAMKHDIEMIRKLDLRHPLIENILAGLLFTLDQSDEAFQRLDEAIERTPDVPLLQFMKGYGYDLLGNYDKSILAYTAAVRLDNQDDEIFARRAVALSRAGDYLGALDDVRAIERINPKRSDLSTIRDFVVRRDRTPAPKRRSSSNPSPSSETSKKMATQLAPEKTQSSSVLTSTPNQPFTQQVLP